jgi:hypothetical protein
MASATTSHHDRASRTYDHQPWLKVVPLSTSRLSDIFHWQALYVAPELLSL